jgi:hypothetical protein
VQSTALAPFLLALCGACASSPGSRGEAGGAVETEVGVGPVLWLAGFEGDVSTGDAPGEGATLDDPLALDAGIMGLVEVRRGEWSLLAEGLYVDYGASTRELGLLTTEVSIQAVVASLSVGRTLGRWSLGAGPEREARLDAYVGGRVAHVDLGIDVAALPPSDAATTWVDPIVGLRGRVGFSETLGLRMAGDVGGFGISSDLVWQAALSLDWRPWRHFGFLLGYRVLDYDFDEDDPGDTLGFDVRLLGPFLALVGRF